VTHRIEFAASWQCPGVTLVEHVGKRPQLGD